MSASVEREALSAASNVSLPAVLAPGTVAPLTFDPELDASPQLPGDHPAWARDRLALSFKAREFVATLKPIAIKIRTFWDHHARSIVIGGSRLSIDPSGCYRLDR